MVDLDWALVLKSCRRNHRHIKSENLPPQSEKPGERGKNNSKVVFLLPRLVVNFTPRRLSLRLL